MKTQNQNKANENENSTKFRNCGEIKNIILHKN